jgi:SAM-dependent methyltransferase
VYQDPQYYPSPTTFLCERLPSEMTGQTILDMGCGNGRNTLELLRRGATLIASDPSPAGIDALRKQAEVAGFDDRLRSGVESVPDLEPGTLDGTVLSTVLDHISRAEVCDSLAQIGQALKSDAWVYASVFTVDDPGRLGGSASETNSGVVTYWDPLEFAQEITQRLGCQIVSMSVDWMVDSSHGPRHLHHMLRMFAVKGAGHYRRVVD